MQNIASRNSFAKKLSFKHFSIILVCDLYQHNVDICSSRVRFYPILQPYWRRSSNMMPKISQKKMTLLGIGKYVILKLKSQYCKRTYHKLMSTTNKSTQRFILHSVLLLNDVSFVYSTVSCWHGQGWRSLLFLMLDCHIF